MNQRTKNVPGRCEHCGGAFEFPAEGAGMTIQCPHCSRMTELMLARPPEEPALPRRLIVWSVIAASILALGAAGTAYALKRAETLVKARKAQPAATNNPAAPR